MDRDLLVVLRTRIDQHLKFFDTLERIRWQFTTAFGAGAGAAVFLAVDDSASLKKRVISLVIVMGFSVAGLVVQLRISSLISVLWKRMLVLQSKEYEMLPVQIKGEAIELQKALAFPRLGVLNNGVLRVLNVGMVSCFLFSVLFGIAVALAVQSLGHSPWISIASGLSITLLLAILSFFGVKRYAVAVESSDDAS
jgi:hypothetical protein